MRRLFNEPETVIDSPLVVCVGGGVNSTALLCGFVERGIRPDLLTFADTGGERSKTYEHLKTLSDWCERHDFPPVTIVRYDGPHGDFESDCLKKSTLPSIAFGWKSCSQKWKRAPQEQFANCWPPAIECWENGNKVIKVLGYDADEPQRASIRDDKKYRYWYPLLDWDWGRKECIEAIKRSGMEVPPKSSCFFCPSMEPEEIMEMATSEPELAERAIEMERRALPGLKTVRGLGRDFAWEDLIRGRITLQMARSAPRSIACECFDGATLFDEHTEGVIE